MKIASMFASLVCFSQRIKCEDFQLVESSTSGKEDFTLKILKAEQGNQVFSPINIAHAFGLLLLGAGGETEKEISNILGYGKSNKLLAITFHLIGQPNQIPNCKPVKSFLESTEECLNSIEASLFACNTDSIKLAANLFLNQKFDLFKKYVAWTNLISKPSFNRLRYKSIQMYDNIISCFQINWMTWTFTLLFEVFLHTGTKYIMLQFFMCR